MQNKKIRLTESELKRADAGYVIVRRPNPDGLFTVMGLRVEEGAGIIHNPAIRTKVAGEDLRTSFTDVARDLDKFLGVGGGMSSSGRLRQKS